MMRYKKRGSDSSEYLFLRLALFQVHHGFYFAYHNTTIRPCVINAVKRAKQLYGDIDIMVTGHSMGGAMAAFCGLDLTVIIAKPFLQPLFFFLLTLQLCIFYLFIYY